MPASDARIAANRKNSLLSTGPKTEEGKAQSRRNGLKHGLTGAGIVLAEADSQEVERRNVELQAEFAPQTRFGKILVGQLAMLSVRMERSQSQEIAGIAARVRHAPEDFDQEQFDEAERLMDLLGEEPRIHLRKLKKTPEGIERMIVAWQELRVDLTREGKPTWTAWHRERAENLTGRRIEEASGSQIGFLSKGIWGVTSGLEDEDEPQDHIAKETARASLIERIDAEIRTLEAHYETLDFEMIDLDRAESPERALFDPSREATLARRYESEASRRFFKALKELRQAEAEAAERPTPAASLAPVQPCDPLASSWEKTSTSPPSLSARPHNPVAPGFARESEVARGLDGQVLTIGRPASSPA